MGSRAGTVPAGAELGGREGDRVALQALHGPRPHEEVLGSRGARQGDAHQPGRPRRDLPPLQRGREGTVRAHRSSALRARTHQARACRPARTSSARSTSSTSSCRTTTSMCRSSCRSCTTAWVASPATPRRLCSTRMASPSRASGAPERCDRHRPRCPAAPCDPPLSRGRLAGGGRRARAEPAGRQLAAGLRGVRTHLRRPGHRVPPTADPQAGRRPRPRQHTRGPPHGRLRRLQRRPRKGPPSLLVLFLLLASSAHEDCRSRWTRRPGERPLSCSSTRPRPRLLPPPPLPLPRPRPHLLNRNRRSVLFSLSLDLASLSLVYIRPRALRPQLLPRLPRLPRSRSRRNTRGRRWRSTTRRTTAGSSSTARYASLACSIPRPPLSRP